MLETEASEGFLERLGLSYSIIWSDASDSDSSKAGEIDSRSGNDYRYLFALE
jgi:hypothetical protein